MVQDFLKTHLLCMSVDLTLLLLSCLWELASRLKMVCAAQDFFETRLLSMDTDFRVLSADYLGALPGIDIAQVRGASTLLTALHGHANSHSS